VGVVAVVQSAADPRERRWLAGPGLVAETLSESGVVVGEKACAAIWVAIHIPLRHFNVAACADAAPTVARLAARGFRIGIVTARPLPAALVRRDLRDQGLPEVFEVVVTSGEIGLAKPHPRVFEVALEELGMDAGEVLMVGDSYAEDIVPAAGLGMNSVLKLNDRDPDPAWALASHQVRSLDDLLRLDLLGG